MAAGGTVTLFEGAAFCTSSTSGDIDPATQGLFVLDARLISELSIEINGERPETLAAEVLDPHRATFVARIGETLVVERHRSIGDGLPDEIVVRNVGSEASYVEVAVTAEADFASPLAVRDGRARPGEVASRVDG